jgi:hypothetical protein
LNNRKVVNLKFPKNSKAKGGRITCERFGREETGFFAEPGKEAGKAPCGAHYLSGGLEIQPFDQITAETKYNRDDEKDTGEQLEAKQNAQRAFVTRRALQYNGAVNSEIRFYMEPETN